MLKRKIFCSFIHLGSRTRLILLTAFILIGWISFPGANFGRYQNSDIKGSFIAEGSIREKRIRKEKELIVPISAETSNSARDASDMSTVFQICLVTVTAYSSTPDQTDDTPFITASGTRVRDGVAAANFLPFKTKVRFPDFYGDKVFVIEDRMRSDVLVDLWFPSRYEALQFGIKKLRMEILTNEFPCSASVFAG